MSGNKRIVVYTAVFGGYDKIRPPLQHYGEEAHYYVVTEPATEVPEPVKHIYGMPSAFDEEVSPRMQSRWYKMHPHVSFPDAEITIWHGGNIQLTASPEWMVSKWLCDADIALFKHPHRNCVYREAEAVVGMGKTPKAKVEKWVKALRLSAYPAGNGLSACWFMIRRNNAMMKDFNELWYAYMENYRLERDQLFFDYLLWGETKLGYAPIVRYIPGNLLTSSYFKYNSHRSV